MSHSSNQLHRQHRRTLALEKVAEEEETVAMEVKVEAQARSEATKVECEALSSHSDDKHHGARNC